MRHGIVRLLVAEQWLGKDLCDFDCIKKGWHENNIKDDTIFRYFRKFCYFMSSLIKETIVRDQITIQTSFLFVKISRICLETEKNIAS